MNNTILKERKSLIKAVSIALFLLIDIMALYIHGIKINTSAPETIIASFSGVGACICGYAIASTVLKLNKKNKNDGSK